MRPRHPIRKHPRNDRDGARIRQILNAFPQEISHASAKIISKRRSAVFTTIPPGKERCAIQRPIDNLVYTEEIAPRLPRKIIDCHVHVGLPEHCGPISPARLKANWALEVGVAQSWEDLRRNYRTLFPDREVSVLAFGGVFKETDVDANNSYILAGTREAANNALGLLVTRPEWEPERIKEGMAAGFAGIKPYPDLAQCDQEKAGIFDFLPKRHLKALDELGGILMLHLPRADRLANPDNVKELLNIADEYQRIKMIVAHIGRSFCLPTARRGLPHFANSTSIYFDTSANLNSDVFQYALETIGPDRLLFGSDLPVTMMRGVREHVGDRYINYTDAAYSWNVNRKSPEEEANYTYFLYEELRAIIRAVDASGLGADAVDKIMFWNSAKILGEGER